MIHSFIFKNFCSFRKDTILDFSVSAQTPECDSFEKSIADPKLRLNKVNVFLGPNASGKTSLLKAFAFLRSFACESLYWSGEDIPVDPFKFCIERSPVEFEIIFEINGNLYKYLFQLTATCVLKEELYKRNDTNYDVYLFKRHWDDIEKKSVVFSKDIGLNDKAVAEVLKKNVSVLSASMAFKNDVLKEIQNYFTKFETNVKRFGKKSINEDSFADLEKAGSLYSKDADLFMAVKSFLSSVDLGINDIELEKLSVTKEDRPTETKEIVVPVGIHNVDGKKYSLHFALESSGTKSLFILMGRIFSVLRGGGVAVLDELEAYLHPHILPGIGELFSNSETNPKKSQLIFSTHSLEMLNHLEKEQIFLIEKDNKKLESEVYRLDQIQGIRRDDNFYSKYMAGKFGAVPNL